MQLSVAKTTAMGLMDNDEAILERLSDIRKLHPSSEEVGRACLDIAYRVGVAAGSWNTLLSMLMAGEGGDAE